MAVPRFLRWLHLANVLWFGSASFVFTVGAEPFVRAHLGSAVPVSAVPVVVYAVRFLGGMNAGLALLAAFRLRRVTSFRATGADGKGDPSWGAASPDLAVLTAFAVAHGSQFLFNISAFRSEWLAPRLGDDTAGGTVLVFGAQMLAIFVLDFTMGACNAVAAWTLTGAGPAGQKQS